MAGSVCEHDVMDNVLLLRVRHLLDASVSVVTTGLTGPVTNDGAQVMETFGSEVGFVDHVP